MSTVTEIEPVGTLSFSAALEQAELLARQALGASEETRISAAVAIIRSGDIFEDDRHVWTVASQSEPGVEYRINGAGCSCPDATYRAEGGRCKHVIATMLSRRAMQLISAQQPEATPEATEAPAAVPNTPLAADETPGIDPRHVTYLHGKPFVKYAGLLAMAHERGLVSLKARFISVTAEMALAEAEATFANGTTYNECADSTPGNVPAHIKPHFPRMALTRAKARALRDALNLGDMCAAEEVE